MARKKAPKDGEAPAGEEAQPQDEGSTRTGRNQIALRAPKGYAAIGIPLDGDETLQVKVPKNGIVRVSRAIADRLMQEGFTQIKEADED